MLGGDEGGGAGRGRGAGRAFKAGSTGAGAAQPRSSPSSGGRAFVYVSLGPVQVLPAAPRPKSGVLQGSSPRPQPCKHRAPLTTPSWGPGPRPGTAPAAPFSPLRPRAARANAGPSADGPLSLPAKKKIREKGGKQLGGCSPRVELSRKGYFGVLCGLFSHGRSALHPFPRKGRGGGGGKSEHKSSNRSGSAKSPGSQENPDQHVHHLLAPAAAILTVFPPSLQVL